MLTIEQPGLVDDSGHLCLRVPVPGTVSPGLHRVVLVIDETPSPSASPMPGGTEPFDFPIFPRASLTPAAGSLRRVDLYGEEDDTGGR